MAAPSDGLISKTLDSLVNGVSQQPPSLRIDSQCAEQINLQSRVVEGPRTRPPAEYVARAHTAAIPTAGYHVHFRSRDELTQHVVLIEDGDIRVFNLLTGAEATVNIAAGADAYLAFAGADAQDAFAVISVADFTFIVNREVTVEMSGTVSAARTNEFLVWVTDANPPNDEHNWQQTLGAVSQDKVINMKEPFIAPALAQSLMKEHEAGGTPSNEGIYHVDYFPLWTFVRRGSLIHGLQTSGSFAQIHRPHYAWSDDSYEFISQTTFKFSDLPGSGIDGFLTEIIGEDGNEDGNYWVKYSEDDNAWLESVGPELDNDFDEDTMPHALTQVGPDEFDFGPLTWASREAGDIDTAPEPSFVGREISDISFHKNRLGLFAGENIVLSEAGEFFNFWPTTVATLVDSDPIDVAGTNNRIAPIDFAIPYDQKLYTFSGLAAVQNILVGGDALTTQNAEVVEASAFSSSSKVRPKAAGKGIYFAVERDASTSVIEYTIADLVADGVDIAAHVPTYIPGNVKFLASSQKESMLVLFSEDTPNALYVYSYFFDGPSKKQSSWSRWEFDPSYVILGVEWLSDKLYIVAGRDDGVHIERLDMGRLQHGEFGNRICLDSLYAATGVFTVADGLTRWTLPYEAVDGTFLAILSDADFAADHQQAVAVTSDSDPLVVMAEGDFSAGVAHIGRLYSTEYEFTKPVIFVQGGDTSRGVEPVTQGRLQIRKFKVLVRASGGFEARVTSDEVTTEEELQEPTEFVYLYPEKVTGQGTFGAMVPRPADLFSFDVGMDARYARIKITSTSFRDLTLIAAEWQGFYTARSARL